MVVGLVDHFVDPSPDGNAAGALLFLIVFPILCIVWSIRYHVTMTWRWGRTLGKLLLGLKVIPVGTDGTVLPTRQAAALREAARGFSAVVPVVNLGIGAILLGQMLRNRPYWQSKWDRAAGTVVVRSPARG
jgi:uncharacterized RDD family membrane protein YckC